MCALDSALVSLSIHGLHLWIYNLLLNFLQLVHFHEQDKTL